MKKPDNAIKQKAVIDKPISIVCVVIVGIFVALMAAKPDATLDVVNKIFDVVTSIMGVPILWFVFIGLFICLYLAFSRHGNIKLGDGKPEYSMFSYIAMMMCAALAATATYYSFVEWSFYYAEPAFSIKPLTQEAAGDVTAVCILPLGIQRTGHICAHSSSYRIRISCQESAGAQSQRDLRKHDGRLQIQEASW